MFLKLASAFSLAAALALPASATIITPGSTAFPSTFSGNGLSVVELSSPHMVTASSATFTATYQMGVFKDANNTFCPGCLDFIYSVANDYGSPQGIIESIAASSFTGYQTNVGYINTGKMAPDFASRSIDGDVVKFYFNDLEPGTTADFLVIQTDAKNYTAGNWSIQDGSTLSLVGFQPSAVTPEPSSLILLGTGLLSAAGAARRKLFQS